MKCLIICLALGFTLMAVQGAEEASSSSQSVDRQPRFFDIIGSIIGVIDQIVKQVQASLDHMQQEAGKALENIGQQMAKFFQESVNEVQKFINQTEAEIESLITDKILPCLNGTREKFDSIKNQTYLELQKCDNQSKSSLEDLKKELDVYANNTNNQINGIRQSLQTCIDEPDFGEKIKCAVDASRVISNNVGQILQNIGNSTQTIIFKGSVIAGEHQNCTSNAREVGKNQTIILINEVKDCIAKNMSN